MLRRIAHDSCAAGVPSVPACFLLRQRLGGVLSLFSHSSGVQPTGNATFRSEIRLAAHVHFLEGDAAANAAPSTATSRRDAPFGLRRKPLL